MLPTPVPLSAGDLGSITGAMGEVMGQASTLSMQPVGLAILGLVGFILVFEALRVFLIKRSSR